MNLGNILTNLNLAKFAVLDPGASQTIRIKQFLAFVPLVSLTTETRAMAAPVKSGQFAVLEHKTDAGDITVTVSGGYNEDGDTTIVFSDPGQWSMLMSVDVGSTPTWRKIADHATANLSPTEAALLLGLTAGTGLASKALTLDASGNVAMPAAGSISLSTTGEVKLSRAVLVALGTDDTNAAPIITQVAAVTGADGVKGVALPAAAATVGPLFVINTVQTAPLFVYPVTGGNDLINGFAEDLPIELGPGEAAWFVPTSATQWYCAVPNKRFDVKTVAATRILTARDNGATIILSHATEFDTKLPAPARGLRFHFIVGDAPETASYTITTNGTTQNVIHGLTSSGEDAAGAGAGTNGTPVDVVTFVDGKAQIGDWVELHCDGTLWYLRGQCYQQDAITLA